MPPVTGTPAPSINCCRNLWQALQPLLLPRQSRPRPRPSALEPVPPMPAALSPDGERPLLEAIARSYPFRKQIETKEQTGHVRAIEAARIEANLDQAKLDLAGIKRNLASLSAGGLPTYALIHSVASNGSLNAWIVFPDGGVVAGATTVPYRRPRHTAGRPRRRSDRRDSRAAAERRGKAATRCRYRC